jgi:hypothetical protein
VEKVTVEVTVNRDGSTVKYTGDRDLVQPLLSQAIAMQHAVPESDAVQISRDRTVVEGQKILSTVSVSQHRLQFCLASVAAIVAVMFILVSCNSKEKSGEQSKAVGVEYVVRG